MAADHLAGNRLDDVAEAENSIFLGNPCMEDHLEKEVAELVLQIVKIAPLYGIRNLVRFLDRVGSNRREILLGVPGAAGDGCAELRHDCKKLSDVLAWLHYSCGLQRGESHVAPEARSTWPRSRPGSILSRTRRFSSCTSGKPPSRCLSHTISPFTSIWK